MQVVDFLEPRIGGALEESVSDGLAATGQFRDPFYQNLCQLLMPLPVKGSTTTGQTSLFTVDPARFISLADFMRVALWEER
jgi:hypothetical protein